MVNGNLGLFGLTEFGYVANEQTGGEAKEEEKEACAA